MKPLDYLFLPVFLPVLLLFITSCEEEIILSEDQPSILEVSLSETSSVTTPQEISVTIDKPTPCHYVSEVKETISDKTYSYNIILLSGAEICTTVIEEETVTVSFNPATNGEYTLNFLINGKLHETRTVTVTE